MAGPLFNPTVPTTFPSSTISPTATPFHPTLKTAVSNMTGYSQCPDSRMSRSGGSDLRSFMHNIRANRDTWASYQPSRPNRHKSAHSTVGKSSSKRQQIKNKVRRAIKTASRKVRAYRRQSQHGSASQSASRLPPTPLTASQMYRSVSRYPQASGRTLHSGFFSPTLRDRLNAVSGVPDDASSFLGHVSTPEVQRVSPSGKRLTIHEASGSSAPATESRRNARYCHPVVSAVIAQPRPLTPGSSPSVSWLDSWEVHDEMRFSSASGQSALTDSSSDAGPGLDHSRSLERKVQQVFRRSVSGREALNTIDGLKNLPRPAAHSRPDVASSITRSSQVLPSIAANGALFPQGTFDTSSDTDRDSDSDSVVRHHRDAALAALETKPTRPAPTAAPKVVPAHRLGRPPSTGGLFLPETSDAKPFSSPTPFPSPKPLPKLPAPPGGLYLAYMGSGPFNPFNEKVDTPPPPPPKPVPARPLSTGPSTPDFADTEQHRKHYSKVELTGSFLLDDSSEEDTLPASRRSATPDFEVSNERHSKHYLRVESGVWDRDEDNQYSRRRPILPTVQGKTAGPSMPAGPETPRFRRNDMAHEMQCGRTPSTIIDDGNTSPSQPKKPRVSQHADPSTSDSGMASHPPRPADSDHVPASKDPAPAQHPTTGTRPGRSATLNPAPPQLADPRAQPVRPQPQIKRKPVPAHAVVPPRAARVQHAAGPRFGPRPVDGVARTSQKGLAKEDEAGRKQEKKQEKEQETKGEGKWAGLLRKAAAGHVCSVDVVVDVGGSGSGREVV